MTESRKTVRSLRSMCGVIIGHLPPKLSGVCSLFFKAWRCNIMYDDWRAQVLRRSTYTLGKRNFRIRQTVLGLKII